MKYSESRQVAGVIIIIMSNNRCYSDVYLKFKPIKQGRIQDFEMGGENITKNQKIKYYFNIWGIRKKKRKKGAQKKGEGGGENSPISPPLDPRLLK